MDTEKEGKMQKELGVGIVGWGFIGKVHTYAYINLPLFYQPPPAKINLVGVCTAHEKTADAARKIAGFKFATTSYKDLLEREDIDIINCCTPNYLHKNILIDALKAGKHIYCDKPLALNLKEARDILKATEKSSSIHQMTFEYRFIPAIMRAKQLIREGFLGDVFSFRGCYLHSGYIDPSRPVSWRLDREKSGGGALFDLGSHILDLVRHLLGEYKSVFATSRTFIKERPLPDNLERKKKVEVDDISILQVELENGGIGTIEVSRLATGANDELRIEIHGQKGAIYFNLMDPNWLWIYDTRDPGEPIGGFRGFKKIETVQRYPKPASLPGPKFSIGWMRYHIASQYDFVKKVVEGKKGNPSFYDGYKVQEVMEAAQISAREKRWVNLNEL
ncbi:hypothetical protein DRI96_01200 [Candidatus Aerophobetes bacterium]|uniref:Gfo/Idh/MocA family oxidoreductase n=1 Tax=Aerophobetes bacterium TaxID=2030807 RepID=A0A662DKF7_UNCAE|nr:MAG: hypothetical protein DRI96_01200 [Candidatus Aerophobetes bacterium]